MPAVSVKFPIHNTNDPSVPYINEIVDLPLLLSEYYGKNIRQGQAFKVKAMQATLVPASNWETRFIDTGLSATVKMLYQPTTKHSRRAWNEVFRQWSKQKQLSGKIGSAVRNDDMEFAWDATTTDSRTSTIYGQGMGDTSSEYLCLTGDSSQSTDFVLKDYYNSFHKPPASSYDHFTNSAIKSNKFGGSMYPENCVQYLSAYNSTGSFIDWGIELGITVVDMEALTSATAASPIATFPQPLDIFCGVTKLQVFVMPDDTAVQIEEDFDIVITFFITSWSPLIYRKGKSKSRKRSYSRGRRNRSRRGKRRYG